MDLLVFNRFKKHPISGFIILACSSRSPWQRYGPSPFVGGRKKMEFEIQYRQQWTHERTKWMDVGSMQRNGWGHMVGKIESRAIIISFIGQRIMFCIS
jgi:hypothetical protein